MTQQVRIIQMKRMLLKDSYDDKKSKIQKRITALNYSKTMNDSQYMLIID